MDTSSNNHQDNKNNVGDSSGDDDSLPINLYDIHKKSAFVQLELNLKTFEPERIAMDAVVVSTQKLPKQKYQQKQQAMPTIESSNDSNENNNNSSTTGTSNGTIDSMTSGEYQLQSVHSSLEAMNLRIAILLDFLRKTQTNEIPIEHKLLREINALIQQLSFVMNHHSNNNNSTMKHEDNTVSSLNIEYNDMMILTYFATIAKTTKAVEQYSNKYLKVISSTSIKPKSQWATHHLGSSNNNNNSGSKTNKSSTSSISPYSF